jgi:acyl-CoA synthetase (AMP-forming)/AMP-acid ligase II
MAQDIASFVRRAADRYPDRTALVFEDRRWSYFEWNRRINRLAHALSEMGICPGDRVAFYLTNSEGSVTTYMACQKLGAVAVPCNFRLKLGELEQIVRDAGARILVYSKWATDTVQELSARVKIIHDYISAAANSLHVPEGHHHLESLLVDSREDREPIHRNTSESISSLVYTSGTTGKPKGVIHTHGNDFAIATNCVMEYSLRRTDVALHIAPLYHVGGMQAYFLPHVLVGGTNVVMGRYELERTVRTIAEEKITSLFAVPTQLEEILEYPHRSHFDLGSLKMITTGGASSRAEILTRTADVLCPGVYNGYGLTEASLSLVLQPEDAHVRPESCGKPTLISDVRIVANHLDRTAHPDEEVSPGEAGQLIIRGPQVTPGYWNNSLATQEKLRQGWLYTGDLFSRDQDGFYIFHGRLDDMIVSGGENIQPQEVEFTVKNCPGVSDAVVIGLPHPRWGRAVTAFVVGEADVGAVFDFCRNAGTLSRYKCPKKVVRVNVIPRNATGKIVRYELAKQFSDLYQNTDRENDDGT